METRRLRYFKTIADEGQITRAAKKLHIAQPPLSQQLKLLEEELNVTLFERNGRSLVLTESGEALYRKASFILNEIEDTIVEVKAVNSGVKGVLKIGANKSCFAYLLQQVTYIRERFPGVQFKIREGDTYTLTKEIEEREIELAILRLPVNEEDFSTLLLPPEPYMFVISDEWEGFVQKGTSIEMKDLDNIPLLLLHRLSGKGQFEIVTNEFKRLGFTPNVVVECPDAAMLLSLTAAGAGGTIVPRSTLEAFSHKNLKVFELKDFHAQAEAALLWAKDRYLSKPAREVIANMEELY
ncbi:DNA-binding transcriptional LysR family regulator [Geomicrobium halophilum]|uniref:DNA-binding transcriptional LysR family regulator n=1 Tax=Geomicrobium halophilum TaxID=549000 RepID=A0A841Q2S2_9BACL|nr:LysR family transcriptional regulator [Geomicrobium halophilum]MBB6451298.1 DNA-binding transcriptional LysR family regulator [Geomicrobium halophilum]